MKPKKKITPEIVENIFSDAVAKVPTAVPTEHDQTKADRENMASLDSRFSEDAAVPAETEYEPTYSDFIINEIQGGENKGGLSMHRIVKGVSETIHLDKKSVKALIKYLKLKP